MTSHVGSSTPGTTSCALPSHTAGDLILLWAYRDGSNTLPSVPSGQGWVVIRTGGSNTNAGILAAKIAQSSSEGVGTWTNATTTLAEVYRPASGKKLAIGAFEAATGSGTTVTYPALTLLDSSGASWVAGFAGHRSTNTALANVPSGWSNRSNPADGTDEAASCDSNGGLSSWAGADVSVGGTSSGWRTTVVEIREYTDEMAAWASARDHVSNNAIWLAIGHSHVAGHSSTGSGLGGNAASGAYSRQVANAFTACPAHGVSFMGDHNAVAEGSTTNAHDNNISLGGGAWAESHYDSPAWYNVGGSWFANVSSGSFSFSPGVSFNAFRVYHTRYPGAGECTVNINGGSSLGTLDQDGVDTMVIERDFTGLSTGTHTINVVGAGGFGFIFGIAPYRTDQKQAIFINAGFSGSRAEQWATYLDEMALITRHGTSIHLDGNDYLTGRTVAQFEADMAAIVAESRAHGSVIVLSSVFIDPTGSGISQSTQAQYHDAAERVAAVYGCAFVRGTDQTGFANYNGSLMDADGVHMPAASYWTAYGAPLLALLDASVEEVTGTGASDILLSASGSGAHGVAGTGASSVTLVAAGTGTATPPEVTGAGASDVLLVAAGTGAHGVAGTGASSVLLTAAGEGEHTAATVTGTGASDVLLSASGTGVHGVAGTGASDFLLVADGEGEHTSDTVVGIGASDLILSASGAGAHGVAGQGASLFGLSASGIGAHGVTGIGTSSILLIAEGDGAVAVPVTGIGASSFILVAAGVGTFTNPAGWFPVLPASETWAALSPESETWTPASPASANWTTQ